MANVDSIFDYSNSQFASKNLVKSLRLFSSRHPKFKELVRSIGQLEYRIPLWESIDDAVLYAVIGQMLSFKAAQSIIKRLIEEFKSSKSVIAWAEGSLRRKGPLKGVSWRKRKALAEWSRYARGGKDIHLSWKNISIEEYKTQITSIWGFGKWSADMIAIFYLGREDVWPVTDVALKRSCKKLLGSDNLVKVRELVRGCETIAALYLWQALSKIK